MPWSITARGRRPSTQNLKKKNSWDGTTNKIPLHILVPFWPFLVWQWLEMRQVSDSSSQTMPGERASWRGLARPELAGVLLSLSSGRESASSETCNCFLAGAQENKCWLSSLVPSPAFHPCQSLASDPEELVDWFHGAILWSVTWLGTNKLMGRLLGSGLRQQAWRCH